MHYRLIQPNSKYQNLSPTELILTNRGIKLEDIKRYINISEDELLDPDLIMNNGLGAYMLIAYLSEHKKILVQVDSDCDGMTSAALLLNYIHCINPTADISYRLHTGKQHGLILDSIPEDVDLVIAPDSSSNDYEVHKALAERGTQVLVIDHHEADKISEYALVINNQLCDYPTKSLSGVGMVYKFCCLLDRLTGNKYAENYKDLVAIGLIADMMDIRDFETRFLIVDGIRHFNNPFLRAIEEKQSYSIIKGGGLNPHTIGFYIAPAINAVMRVGTMEEKTLLFESMLDWKGEEMVPSTKRGCKGQLETLADQACRMCTNVRNRQTAIVDESIALIEDMIKEKDLLKDKILIIQLNKDFDLDRGITGLVANKLMAEYQRPTLILHEVIHDGIKTWEGSGRAPSDTQFEGMRAFLKESGLALYAEGHENALGVGISDEKFLEFKDYSEDKLKDCDFTPCYKVDLIWQSDNFNPKDILDIADLESLWGQEMAKPLIALEGIKVSSNACQLLKETTLKISLPNGVTLIKFGSNQEEYESLCGPNGQSVINVVGECCANSFGGNVTPQIQIKDFEIVGERKYYF